MADTVRSWVLFVFCFCFYLSAIIKQSLSSIKVEHLYVLNEEECRMRLYFLLKRNVLESVAMFTDSNRNALHFIIINPGYKTRQPKFKSLISGEMQW